jgi:F0F1-type ATP synthase membrane subunit c/vacuolar-type H+-ATPase subunit K
MEQSQSATRRQTLWILWAGFLSAVFVYGVVVATIATPSQQTAAPEALRLSFLLVALPLGGASIWWKRRSTGETQFMPAAERKPSFEQFQTNCIVTWALSEAVGVVGLLLGILTRDPGAFLPFGVGAALLLVIHRPNSWPQYADS